MRQSICCIGAGYIGGPTMAVMAQHNPQADFYVVDIDQERIRRWNSDDLPIYEPGLREVIEETRGKNLWFSTDVEEAVKKCEMIFIGVNTPTKTHGNGAGKASDLTYWESAAKSIAMYADSDKIIIEKSTLPVKTSDLIKDLLRRKSHHEFKIVSNPEFLAEGTAISDLQNPSRVLIGGDEEAAERVAQIYEAWIPREKIVTTSCYTAELTKLAANAILAQRVSSINTISEICDSVGADVHDIEKVLKMDDRIGSKFLTSGVGFGGSCFKKDILNMIYICESLGLDEVAEYWEQVIKINEHQIDRIMNKLLTRNFNTLRDKKIGILGYSFKANSGDVRETQAKYVIKRILAEDATVYVTDPKAKEGFLRDFRGNNYVKFVDDVDELMKVVDDYVIMTDWDQYKRFKP